jgi:hypothetical protein
MNEIPTCEIIVISRGQEYTVIIDEEDYDVVSKQNWFVSKNDYVYCHYNNKTILLHRLLLKYEGKLTVDHINHDKLDNRKSNLRTATYSQNNMNFKNMDNGVSPYKGNKWRARIKVNYKDIYIGIFKTKEEATEARVKKELEIFKQFSKHYKHKKIK